ELGRALALARDPHWITDNLLTGLRLADAVAKLHADARDCAGERLLIIESLDGIVTDPGNGEAIAAELHRLLAVHPDLHLGAQRRLLAGRPARHLVGRSAAGGKGRTRTTTPELTQRFGSGGTRPSPRRRHADLSRRALGAGGARGTRQAIDAAGGRLAATPP